MQISKKEQVLVEMAYFALRELEEFSNKALERMKKSARKRKSKKKGEVGSADLGDDDVKCEKS